MSFVWTRLGGTATSDGATGVAVDSIGNIYITGFTWGTLPGETNYGFDDIFLMKYDSHGTLVWTRQTGSPDWDDSNAIAIDRNDNIYVTGGTTGSFDGNPHNGQSDIYLVKFDTHGNKIWSRETGSPPTDIAHGMTTDSAGNIYLTGETDGDLDGNTSQGGRDIFLIKYDGNGNKIFTKQFGSASSDYGTALACDSADNIYLTGITDGSLPGQASAGNIDMFLAKYDTSGNNIWTVQTGSTFDDYGQGLAIDNNSNIIVTGYTYGGMGSAVNAGDLGSSDVFLIKFDPTGAILWTQQPGTMGNEVGTGVAEDGYGNSYVTGYTSGAWAGHTNAGGDDLFLLKFDAAGNLLWTKESGTALEDLSYGVAIYAANRIYLAGRTESNLEGETNLGNWDSVLMNIGYPETIRPSVNYPYPNPVITGLVNFRFYSAAIDPEIEIKIYNLNGELVATLADHNVDKSQRPTYYYRNWDCRNEAGKKLASGVYIYVIKLKDGKTNEETLIRNKFAIIK